MEHEVKLEICSHFGSIDPIKAQNNLKVHQTEPWRLVSVTSDSFHDSRIFKD
jgi:hypothetical protein